MAADTVESQYDFYIGIDFGTSNSGYAYAQLCQKDPHLQCRYPEQKVPYPKTKTSLLYCKNALAEPLGWGCEALLKFLRMIPEQREQHIYLENFKLALAPENKIVLPCGLQPVKVVADYLRCLWRYACTQIKERTPAFTSDRAKIAIAVPAGWSEISKAVMREAAHQAGITTTLRSESLVLVHEPEAAALLVRTREALELPADGTFMVVDAGGGTVDITLHNIVKKDGAVSLSEAAHRQGLMAGGRLLDQAFEELVRKRVGPKLYGQWKDDPKNAVNYTDFICKDWERVKQEFDGSEKEALKQVSLPSSLRRMLTSDQLEDIEAESGDEDYFPVWTSQLKQMYDGIVSQVLPAISSMVHRAGSCPRFVAIVGGLGSNAYFIQAIRGFFTCKLGQCKVVSPPYPYSAIVEGAVLYGQKPGAIMARRSLLTYGVQITGPKVPGCPIGKEDIYVNYKGIERCLKHFCKYVARDQAVSVGSSISHDLYPTEPGQKIVHFRVYATDQPTAKYTTDPGMRRVGEVVLKIANPDKVVDPDRYHLKCMMSFGSTEMTVKAQDMQTGQWIDAHLDFIAE